MNGSKGYRAPDASEKSVDSLPILSLTTVQKMLPLVHDITRMLFDRREEMYESLVAAYRDKAGSREPGEVVEAG